MNLVTHHICANSLTRKAYHCDLLFGIGSASMKAVAFQSSPNLDGLTSTLTQAILKGVQAEGGETELVHLNKFNVEPCIACGNGWGECKDRGTCVLRDDFQILREKIAESDALIFSTPVYCHDISESAKIFLDRLRRCESGIGFKTFAGKNAMGLTSAGGSGKGAVRALCNLEEYLLRLGFAIFDLVTVTRLSKNHKLEMLEKAGRHLVVHVCGDARKEQHSHLDAR